MPRPKKDGSAEPKKRSRTGCWPCKARKVKCGEEKPACANCAKSGEACDYSIRLNWGGRARKDHDTSAGDGGSFTFVATPASIAAPTAKAPGGGHEHVFSSQHISLARPPLRHRPASSGSRGGALPTPEIVPSEPQNGAIDPALRLAKMQHQAQHPQSYELPPYSHFSASVASPPERSPPTSAPAEFSWSPQHSAKRVKLSPRGSPAAGHISPRFAVPQYPPPQDQASPGSAYFTPHSISSIVNTPATPGSSINSASPYPGPAPSLSVNDPPDLRRLSVKSLLSDPSEDTDRPRYPRTDSHGSRTYGYDHGQPDLDVPRNDDHGAMGPRSPDLRRTSHAVSEVSTSSDEADPKMIAFEPGGYYAQPVAIKIPRVLEPLPRELIDNPMNLLYFHHFLNHTARIMVPHDCPENPLRGVLPQMAVRNNHLLHLMLAFSASHRARLLNHPEPQTRIAEWMSDVLPALRQALSEPSSPGVADPTDPSSLAPLATAIMLASLEIVSPNTFAVPISWQNHLQIARQMIVAKGGLHHLAQQANGARDKAIFFLSRWFAYLDVLGSLSGAKHAQPLYGAYDEDGGGLWLVNRSDEEIYQIDCFFGFSGRCIALLAGVADLAAECDKDRVDPATRQPRPEWKPTDSIRTKAMELELRLEASAKCVYRGCMHTHPSYSSVSVQTPETKSDQDVAEIYATNEAYHWAGLLHLSRRVLNLPSSDQHVQDLVGLIVRSLESIRRGSTAESCLLFPMFSAGCEAQGEGTRRLFMERLTAVEGWGMQHVTRAKALMQRVWQTGEAWEGMVDGEFFG